MNKLKKRLFFVAAAYFAFWARIVLKRWHPRIVVITGSSGKTTTLHLVEAQLGDTAIYSHHANSAFGIPFDLLGLNQVSGSRLRWLSLAIFAPFKVVRSLPSQSIYIVEADCDRPHEGAFLAKLLKPEVVLWVSVYRTHSMNFDRLVKGGTFPTHEAAIAHEFGNFIAAAQQLVAVDADIAEIVDQLKRVPDAVRIVHATIKKVKTYELTPERTVFTIDHETVSVPGMNPKALGINVQLVQALMDYLGTPLDPLFNAFETAPGRNNVFRGIKNTTLIDSTYNTGLGATAAVLEMFAAYPAKQKWAIIGDILEQGNVEAEEHERLGKLLATTDLQHIVLLGPRTRQYTYDIIKQSNQNVPIVAFTSPKEVLDYLEAQLKGNEALLFKGARGLEGVVEALLLDPAESAKLVRRGPRWVKYRQKWGLPK